MPLAGRLPLTGTRGKWAKLLQKKRTRKRLIALSIVTGNVAILAAVAGVIMLSSSDRASDTPLAANAIAGAQTATNPLDRVSSAAIAETVAVMGNMPQVTAVTNQADSQTTELEMAPVTASVVEKPQVLSATSFASGKDIRNYTVVEGDTVSSIANKFGITSDSVRWSNNITGEAVNAGTNLLIPPVNGIVYTMQAGDTAETLALKYKADRNKIIAYNDAELNGLTNGQRILIPDGSRAQEIANAARSRAAAASASTGSSWQGSATYGGYNGYDFGYCTYWVAKLRAEAGRPVPTNLGNARTWAVRAAAMGLPTGSTPRVGAAVVTKTAGFGHVAYVTDVHADGSITVSEMNSKGWNKVSTRTMSGNFQYIY